MNTCQKFRSIYLKKSGIKLKDCFVSSHGGNDYYVEIQDQPGVEVNAHCKDCAIVEVMKNE